MRRLKQIWFLAGAASCLIVVIDISTAKLGSGGWLWYLLIVPLLGSAVGSREAAFKRRVPDKFHVKQVWFVLGAITTLLLAEELHSTQWLIGLGGGYVLALALLGAATGSVVSASRR
jgi:hypothetical protein